MWKLNIDFSDEGLGKLREDVVQRMKDQFRERLVAAGLADRVKITFSEDARGFPVDFDLQGSAEDIATAKEALHLDERDVV